ncbi:uncharacterized protein LOC106720403 [Papilio machaon]|uniref:uncharacterized protein LOC106720403 n=1 Tax=Papilio machaon TaxID=76193 RepID=UPI001E664C17|nr:uncharacterized protein LOC106720403 [Papilio machaon]
MSAKFTFLIYYFLTVCHVKSISYDQRQTGEFNVQVDVKDVQIIALMKGGKEEYVDYDYAYDYSEMTIKPQNRTTPKPTTTNGTSAKTDSIRDKTTTASTVLVERTTSPPNISETYNTTLADVTTVKSTVEISNVTESAATTDKKNVTTTSESTITGCKKGFVLNQKGECELKLQGTGNALLKLVKLSQKLKLRRENKSKTEDD